MAITAVGFGGSVDEVQWAGLASSLGSDYEVGGSGDMSVTGVVGADRTVRIGSGSATAHGVQVTSTANETVQLPVSASGNRYDLIVLRRDWTTNTAFFTYVQGTSSATLPARNTNPGVIDDQPLALVRITAGQQLPSLIIDKRVWASKVLTASGSDVLPSRNGTVAFVGGVLRHYVTGLGWEEQTALKLSSRSTTALVGTSVPVPSSEEWRVAVGSFNATVSAGQITITYDAFDHGVLSIVVGQTGLVFLQRIATTLTSSTFSAQRADGTPVPNGQLVRGSFIAIGW